MTRTERRQLRWVWGAMLQRCENPRDKSYRNYGGRGVRVCAAWKASFERFLADMGPRPAGWTLDRKDSTGHYTPWNCRWATRQTQNENRPRWCYRYEVNGQPFNLKQAWRAYGVPKMRYELVVKRVAAGWPVTMALLLPASEGLAARMALHPTIRDTQTGQFVAGKRA